MSFVVKRARALCGCRFRPQGRTPELGLDCVGLACAVYRIPANRIPNDYRLRSGDADRLQNYVEQFFRKVRKAWPGDLLTLRVAPDQLHLAILSERGFIHADAGLRRVVETPGPPPWPILSVHRRRRKPIEK
ncbi:MAG: peptidoglycan endopeptidase [Sphingomonas sp.]|nr:peptidoglycan endopeptidase [Sphingomonas sp.]